MSRQGYTYSLKYAITHVGQYIIFKLGVYVAYQNLHNRKSDVYVTKSRDIACDLERCIFNAHAI